MSRGSIEIPLRDTDEVSVERGGRVGAVNLDDLAFPLSLDFASQVRAFSLPDGTPLPKLRPLLPQPRHPPRLGTSGPRSLEATPRRSSWKFPSNLFVFDSPLLFLIQRRGSVSERDQMWGTSQVTEMDTYVTVFSLLLTLSISPREYVGCRPSSLRNTSVAAQGSLSQVEATSRCWVLIELPTLPSCLLFFGRPVAYLSKALRTGVVLLAISYSCLFDWGTMLRCVSLTIKYSGF